MPVITDTWQDVLIKQSENAMIRAFEYFKMSIVSSLAFYLLHVINLEKSASRFASSAIR